MEGDLENCAYRWKNPGYSPDCANVNISNFQLVILDLKTFCNSQYNLIAFAINIRAAVFI